MKTKTSGSTETLRRRHPRMWRAFIYMPYSESAPSDSEIIVILGDSGRSQDKPGGGVTVDFRNNRE